MNRVRFGNDQKQMFRKGKHFATYNYCYLKHSRKNHRFHLALEHFKEIAFRLHTEYQNLRML